MEPQMLFQVELQEMGGSWETGYPVDLCEMVNDVNGSLESWLVGGIIPNGRTIQVSEIL